MFNVTRPQPGPDCSKDYRSEEVVRTLKSMFHSKCYLCEDKVSDPVVEHFIPHKGDGALKHDWGNLYYACHRCNDIKGTAKGILDCCMPDADVSRAIKCLCPSIPENNVVVEAQNTDPITVNTATLLDRCYNENNTGIRGISRETLHEKLFDDYCKFIDYRRTLKNRDSVPSEKENAKERLKNMADDSYPFSVFWKWHILSDSFLTQQFPAI
jgi:hypothetical protein